ncbi:MAG: ribonucleotide-diphosphate reductase subunit beta [Ktedonobacteraceae bacterium]|nr:ribonucleotide-diphosphate reductase subunit beta [Ktedonobacteraceae bacterium]
MSIEIATASLRELGKLDGDRIIIGEIDDKLLNLPSYRDLYDRWERQQWSTQNLDFRVDRQQWSEVPEQSRPIWMSAFVNFLQGEVSVTNTLIPFCAAVPTEEQRFFLTTQLSDEARHSIFFERFFREVLMLDGPDIESLLVQVRSFLDPASSKILVDGLAEVGQRVHSAPKNMDYLVEGITLYHIITEGTLALAAQRDMLKRNKRLGFYPGFQQGFTAVARDESRHVLFGVKFLRDMVQESAGFAVIIRNTIARYMPEIHATLYGSDAQRTVMASLGEDPDDVLNFGLNSLRKKLKVIGITPDFNG